MKALNYLLAGAMTLGLWSCTSEAPNPDPVPGPDSKGDVFATLTLQLPSARSVTDTTDDNGDYPASSNNGNEVGKDYENNVNDIYVVLAERDETTGAFTYAAKSYSSSVMNQAASRATFTIQLQSSDLKALVQDGPQEVYIFTYCNPTAGLKTYLDNLTAGDFVNETYELTDGNMLPFALSKQFLMTNALLHTCEIPVLSQLIKNNSTVATAFPLGTVRVERVACRFDLEEKAANGGLPKNAYPINDNVSGLPVAYVEFDGMSLINEAKEFYFLPRMAAQDEDWTATTNVCGYELPDNYVVSPNYSLKNQFGAGTIEYNSISDNYFFPIGLTPVNYEYSWVTDEDDNDDWVGAENTSYKIWRYASENTMPLDAQKHGITTGIIFRAEMKALPESMWGTADGSGVRPAETFANALNSGKTVYAYTQTADNRDMQVNTMLGTSKDVWAYAYTHTLSDIRTKFIEGVVAGKFIVNIGGVAVNNETDLFPEVKTGGTYETWNDLLAAVEVTMPEANTVNDGGQFVSSANYNFVAYAPNSDGKYYNYYYYYNRHNDNANPSEMGIMEFATVRNNIYKLKLDKVGAFGQPGDVTPKPDTDDENPDVYFQVSALVLDWVVRVNPIVFE